MTFAEFGPGELERAGVKFVRVRQKHGIPELRIARLHARHVARRLLYPLVLEEGNPLTTGILCATILIMVTLSDVAELM